MGLVEITQQELARIRADRRYRLSVRQLDGTRFGAEFSATKEESEKLFAILLSANWPAAVQMMIEDV